MPTSLPGAVLFDMDGTLVDTEPLWIAAEYALAERHAAPWTDVDAKALIGTSPEYYGAYIKVRMGLELTPDEIIDALTDEVVTAVRSGGPGWLPGAMELVRACNLADIPTGLVTMSYRRLAYAVLDTMHDGHVDTLVAGEDVTNGKPNPDAYALAAEWLGRHPADCVAIEDSPAGAESAEAAGCFVVVVPNQIDIPLTPRRRALDSLAGCIPADLATLAAGAHTGVALRRR
jgi:HAD superfamily hydrolase (TIGR01509 family)